VAFVPRWCAVVPSFFKASGKAFHRQDAKNAKKNLPVRPFSVSSVLSVFPW